MYSRLITAKILFGIWHDLPACFDALDENLVQRRFNQFKPCYINAFLDQLAKKWAIVPRCLQLDSAYCPNVDPLDPGGITNRFKATEVFNLNGIFAECLFNSAKFTLK